MECNWKLNISYREGATQEEEYISIVSLLEEPLKCYHYI